ncbi:hypothetical protein Z517_04376 [Fonsecaea pedrosoi CBS 271.37]|uniref:NTF2-like domain-containing protein n=1 Tax=Fonsecaea pedrosoi CBS 271.37 TaxID=1442368 RepID=A0A0D2DU92_9EURO|nr:uncharacterized protein Z517_04376 [Fonsecaea pedrosoi CBS 271.37]KIW81351.1 hypothetical protein Z517_04376 [Fonsecaea pedrosoi CBS 271.37]
MQYLSVALPLAALASGVLANPVHGGSCANNACLAAVTGKAALGDGALRASHCSSFLATTVTPIVTVTETITGHGGKDNWKRTTVALCPNEVPNYASACNEAAYTSACSCFGYTEVKTTTVAPTTTTKTIWVKPTGGSGASCTVGTSTLTTTVTGTTTVVSGSTCPVGTSTTITETSTKVIPTYSSCPAAGTATTITITQGPATATTTTVTTTETATVTKPGSGSSSDTPSSCVVDDALATTLVENFMILLEFTSYNGTQGAPGRGYQQNVSDATLASDFSDISDSINFMAGFPLGSVTFPSKQAFDYGQGVLQPEVAVTALNIWHDCNTITWRWRITSTRFPVNGINHMIINSEGKIQKNYAEFDNAAWLQSFGLSCATNPPSVASSVALRARALGLGM